MKYLFLAVSLFIAAKDFAQSPKPITIGHSIQLESKLLNEKRTINICLPENYNAEDSALQNDLSPY